jgi:hypothetical protein
MDPLKVEKTLVGLQQTIDVDFPEKIRIRKENEVS